MCVKMSKNIHTIIKAPLEFVYNLLRTYAREYNFRQNQSVDKNTKTKYDNPTFHTGKKMTQSTNVPDREPLTKEEQRTLDTLKATLPNRTNLSIKDLKNALQENQKNKEDEDEGNNDDGGSVIFSLYTKGAINYDEHSRKYTIVT